MGAADGGKGGGPIAAAGDGGSASAPGSPGCGLALPAEDTSIQVNGMSASYIVDVPATYDPARPYPLIFAFRGANVAAEQFRGYLDLPSVAAAEAILVHPNCLSESFSWDVQRDLPLFDSLLSQTLSRYCVDERRIFATGHGSGAYFTNVLGCMRADRLRAIAPLSPGPPPSGCDGGELAVWITQGNLDSTVGAGHATRDLWARRNHCDVGVATPVEPSPCVEYAGCDPGFTVRYCEYDGDLDLPDFATAGVWDFFEGL